MIIAYSATTPSYRVDNLESYPKSDNLNQS